MDKKWIIAILIIFLILSISTFAFAIFNLNKSEDKLKEKAEEQMDYLENKIISMMNALNNISFNDSTLKKTIEKTSESSNAESESSNSSESSESSDSSSSSENSSSSDSKSSQKSENVEKYTIENQGILLSDLSNINWDYMKNNIENIYYTWETSIIDLHELNVNNEDILNFSNSLDKTTLSIKQEDKLTSLINLANLYAYIPNYLEQFSNDYKKINLSYTKACILNSYVFIEEEKWDDVKSQVKNAINYFSKFMNNMEDNNKYSEYKTSKIYVLLNELNNTIDFKDKDLYYIKYRNTIEKLLYL